MWEENRPGETAARGPRRRTAVSTAGCGARDDGGTVRAGTTCTRPGPRSPPADRPETPAATTPADQVVIDVAGIEPAGRNTTAPRPATPPARRPTAASGRRPWPAQSAARPGSRCSRSDPTPATATAPERCRSSPSVPEPPQRACPRCGETRGHRRGGVAAISTRSPAREAATRASPAYRRSGRSARSPARGVAGGSPATRGER